MIVLYCIGGFIALLLITAALIGTKWSIERSISIDAPVDEVWKHVSTLAATNTWNPWLGADPAIKQTYTGTDGTPGASYAWDSAMKNVGAGSQTILSVTPKSEFLTRIDFLRPFKGTAQAHMRLTKEGNNGTKASWGLASSTPYPMNIIKLFGVIEKNMDRDFNKGLGKLKAICES